MPFPLDEHGQRGQALREPVRPRHLRWRYGREGRRSLLDALESPDIREAYDERQKARAKKARQVHRELMQTLACADFGNVPKQAGLDSL
ncbi:MULTISPECIES: hypothetical protein [Kitasatospora]|uniref:hypothetical protein n=1 Tax=Kitasatospora TaxID=2063 RepID=UPI0031D55780